MDHSTRDGSSFCRSMSLRRLRQLMFVAEISFAAESGHHTMEEYLLHEIVAIHVGRVV